MKDAFRTLNALKASFMTQQATPVGVSSTRP
jgi:hypothetical protein